MKKALYSFAMAIAMVASASMFSSCSSTAKTDDQNKEEEKVECEAKECGPLSEAPMFAGIELTQEQKDQLNALVPPCAKVCAKEEGKCCKEEGCDKAECDKPCEKECDKAECDKPCDKAECDKPCDKAECDQPCPDMEAAKAKFFEEVKAILTPEQFEQFEANVANCHKCNKAEAEDCCKKAEEQQK